MEKLTQNSLEWRTWLDAKLRPSERDFCLEVLAKKEIFVPQAASGLLPKDFQTLYRAQSGIESTAEKNPYPSYYSNIVQKSMALMAENDPDFAFTPEQKKLLLEFKLAFPTEVEIYNKSYVYLLGHAETPYFPTGLDFRATLEQFVKDDQVKQALLNLDNQYRSYFIKRARRSG